MSWGLLAVVLLPVTAAVVAVGVRSVAAGRGAEVPVELGPAGPVQRAGDARVRRLARWGSGLTLLAGVALLAEVARNGRVDLVVTDDEGWAVIGLTAGRIEAMLVVLTSFVGLVVQSFASRQLHGDPRAARFHLWALTLVAATNLAAVAASGITFVVGWVATSVAVVALVGHRRGWAPADRAVRTAQRSFGLGDLALLGGVVIASSAAGHLDLRPTSDLVAAIDSSAVVTLAALLLLVGGLVRSALVPFGSWLPATLAAPTPVSALLHAGVVNGAGVLILKFHPLFGASGVALTVAYVAGVVTAVVATSVMIVRTDVKGGLVWSTAGQMGFMVAQIGSGAFAAALFHLVGHAMYKASAFLGAGDAISARSRRAFRPARHERTTPVTGGSALLVAAGSVAAALWLLDPHLNDVSVVLVATFATLTIARALHGWLVSVELAATTAVPAGVAAALAAAFAYVGGVKLVEGFIVDEIPFEVPNAVGVTWVVATIALVAAGSLVVARLPGRLGDRLRLAVYARLVGLGAAASVSARPRPALDATPDSRPADTAGIIAAERTPS